MELAEERQKTLVDTIEKMGKEAVELEKVIFPNFLQMHLVRF